MSNSRECQSVEEPKQLAAGLIADPPAGELERHVLDCEPCAQATLNLVANETLVGAMRGVAVGAKAVGSEPSEAGEALEGDSAAMPERVSLLIQKLRDLPTRDVNDSEWATGAVG